MSKPATLSEEAYKLLAANRKHPKESLSSVIMRFVPRPIRTFGALEKHLDQVDGQLQVDMKELERVRERKRKANHAH
jgi:predicted CopG family antitoxin